ncbi:hypothetical protein HYALB_00008182 [Hymenoscyphus albidus]|uniref:Uncharacterized protein n=1 Tax=Hymenoscyphus albidus TaxID=595503 RepID=A0A9N9Q8R8_9HELO|nr:hypothetical protein HYALB_00008182 [Hymenoscyphus albidus]
MSTTNDTAMSDEEMDRVWKPSKSVRPQSAMAQSFSLALNDLFKIDNSIADLDAAVSEKKRVVSSQTSELEALEARLKATEARLAAKQAGGGTSPNISRSNSAATPSSRPSSRRAAPLDGSTFNRVPSAADLQMPKSPLGPRPTSSQKHTYTAYSPPVPGGLPPTPGASEGEYGSESEYVVV